MKTLYAFRLCTLLVTCTMLFVSCSVQQLTVNDFPDSPCFNKRFIELESKQNKSESEADEYLILMKMCEDQKNSIAEQNETRKVSSNVGAIFLLEASLVIVGLIAWAASSN